MSKFIQIEAKKVNSQEHCSFPDFHEVLSFMVAALTNAVTLLERAKHDENVL